MMFKGKPSGRICACCGKIINYYDECIEIRYGKMIGYVKHPQDRVDYSDKKVDFFHRDCDIAIRQKLRDDSTNARLLESENNA